MNRFKDRFNELIEEKQVKQVQLQKELHLSKNQVHYWIKGKAEPSIDDLINIANYFNVCIDYIVGRQDWY